METAAGAASRKKGRPTASVSASTASSTAGGGGRWADLPEGPLLLVLDRLPSVADFIAVAAVCRSWRAISGPPASPITGGARPPLLLCPVLVPLDPPSRRGGRWVYPRRCRVRSPADPAASYRCLVPSATLASPVIGYSHGHLISRRGRRPLLADIARGDVLRAPKLPPDCLLEHAVLTAPRSAPDCDLLLLSSDSVILRWRVGETEWSEHPLRVDSKRMSRITVFRGQIFTLDLTGRLFAVEFSPHFSVKQWTRESFSILTARSAVPMQLVESGGELMLVRIVVPLYSHSAKVEVFRLDSSGTPSWVKVESLGERALFVDEHGGSVSCLDPSRWGGRSNCIYLARRSSNTWTALSLDGEAMDLHDPKSPLYRANNFFPKWPSPVWVFPSMLY